MRVRLLTLLAGCALVAGCSGDDESPAASTAATRSPSEGAAAAGPAHRRLARAAAGPGRGRRAAGQRAARGGPGRRADAPVALGRRRLDERSRPLDRLRRPGASSRPRTTPSATSWSCTAARTRTGISDETWEWDGTVWSQHDGSAPGARAASSLACDPSSGTVVLYSGNGADAGPGVIRDDTWAWDGEVWTKAGRDRSGPRPLARGDGVRCRRVRSWSTAGTRSPTRPSRPRWATPGC